MSVMQEGCQLLRASGLILVLDTPKGRGVFASQPISKGTTVEVSPVLIFSSDEVEKHTSQTCLEHYTYYWPCVGSKATTQAIALGLGSMFNHSRAKQNVVWRRDFDTQCITYTAHRDIAAGEELCISYGDVRLWFQDADAADSDDVWANVQQAAGGARDESLDELAISGIGDIQL